MIRVLSFLFLLLSFSAVGQRPSPVKSFFPEGTVFHENINYANDTLQKHLLDIYLPPNAGKVIPLVIWLHGGAWNHNDKYADMSYMKQTVKQFVADGYAFASIDYRQTTTKPFPANIQDCNQAIQWLHDNAAKYGYDKNRIALIGFSAGGHLASLVALSNNDKVLNFTHDGKPPSFRIKAVVDFYGPADLIALASDSTSNKPEHPITQLLGASAADRPDLATAASPVTYVNRRDPPFLIVHGEKDESVPVTQSRYLNSWMRLARIESKLIVVPGAPHYGEMFDSEEIRKELFAFLKSHL